MEKPTHVDKLDVMQFALLQSQEREARLMLSLATMNTSVARDRIVAKYSLAPGDTFDFASGEIKRTAKEPG